MRTVNPFLFGSFEWLRRRLAQHQGRPRAARDPMSRLLVGEVAYLARRLIHHDVRRVWLPAAVVSVVIATGLSAVTPGPVLSPGPRWLLAVAAAAGVAAVSVALPRRRNGHR